MLDMMPAAERAFAALLGGLLAMPVWAGILILFSPTILALLLRRGAAVLAALVLNLVAAVAFLAGSAASVPVLLAILAFGLSLVVLVAAVLPRGAARSRSAADERLDGIEKQMTVFLEALDRRTQSVDERAEEARKDITAIRAALARPVQTSGQT